jgi:hypothetical protein
VARSAHSCCGWLVVGGSGRNGICLDDKACPGIESGRASPFACNDSGCDACLECAGPFGEIVISLGLTFGVKGTVDASECLLRAGDIGGGTSATVGSSASSIMCNVCPGPGELEILRGASGRKSALAICISSSSDSEESRAG